MSGILLTLCLVNSFYLLQNFRKAAIGFWGIHGFSNVDRRLLQRGSWYQAVLAVQNQVPQNATLVLVSPAPPWYLAYYLYPRLLTQGSNILSDRQKVRKNHPRDWVLVYSEDASPELTAYPPLGPQRS